MASSKRMEQIKKARSLNDIADVVEDIAFELKNSKAIVNTLVSSMSAEVVFDARQQRPRAGGTKDAAYKAPKLKDIKKHSDVVNRLYASSDELDAAEASLKQAFAGNKRQKVILQEIAHLKSEVNDTLNAALDALQEMAEQHAPAPLTKLTDSLVSYMLDAIDQKQYTDMNRQVFVVNDEDDHSLMHFSNYIGVENLKATSGFTYDTYYVVLTGVVTQEGKLSFFLNSFPDFKVPGKFPIGKEVKNIEEVRRRLDLLLAHNDIAISLDKLPMPIDKNKAKNLGMTSLKGVEDVTVDDDSLIVLMTPGITQKAELEIVIGIKARLRAITGNKDVVSTYKKSTIKGKPALTFILVPDVGAKKGKHLNLERLDEVAEMLDLDDKQKKALRFALQN